MKSFIPLVPFVAALSLIACQRDAGPVAEDAAAPPESVLGDVAAEGLAAPANAASAERADRAAVPVITDGMRWSEGQGGQSVDYGPTGTPPVLSFACRGNALQIRRAHPAHSGKTATMSFTGGGHASSLPMRAVAKPGGPGESEWQGEATGDMARAVARTFSGEGIVDITLGDAPPLAVPSAPPVRALLARCS